MSQQNLSGDCNQPSSVEGSHASRIRVQVNAERLVMSVTSGRKCGESFAKLNQDGSWVKMSQGYGQAKMDGSLEEYCETWPRWGMLLDGVVGELRMSEPGIKENGSLLLPTPTVADSKSNGTPSQLNRDTVNLNTVVKVMFSTPRASDMENPASKRMKGIDHRHQLREEVRMFPTPSSEDNRDLVVDQTSGSLNPRWVEWLMGFPDGWTNLKPSEMPLSHSKSIRSSKRLPILKEEV